MAVPLSRSSQPVDIWAFGTFGMIEPLRSRVRWDWGGDLFTTFLLLKLDEEAKSGPGDSGRETVTEFEDAPIQSTHARLPRAPRLLETGNYRLYFVLLFRIPQRRSMLALVAPARMASCP